MKQIQKGEQVGGDAIIDRLLRSEKSQHGPAARECPEFDPDLANAYAERVLSVTESARYESHLAQCTACRRAVTSLVRMAGPVDAAIKPVKTPEVRAGLLSRLRAMLGGLTAPQWAMAAAAVAVLAISIPVLMSRSTRREAASARQFSAPAAEAQPAREQESQSKSEAGDLVAQDSDAALHERDEAKSRTANGTLIARSDNAPAAVSSGYLEASRANKPAQPVDELHAKAEPEKEKSAANEEKKSDKDKNEAPARQNRTAEIAQQQSGQRAAPASEAPTEAGAAAQKTQATENQLTRIDEKRAQQLPQDSKDAAQVTVLKPGRPDGEQREGKDATIRPEDAMPPSPAASTRASAGENMRARRGLTQPAPKLAIRDNETASLSKNGKGLPEKKINGKRFWLRDDIWTDKDYDPIKELPVVTIVRDSDVFHEVMTKRSGLKPFFTSFGDHDRAIIVYKGTVYKLIPQDASK